jgi:2-polyprenyl-3-methyl-5-hydroxy-6-metoxy-1,4-benzoquinol methylase
MSTIQKLARPVVRLIAKIWLQATMAIFPILIRESTRRETVPLGMRLLPTITRDLTDAQSVEVLSVLVTASSALKAASPEIHETMLEQMLAHGAINAVSPRVRQDLLRTLVLGNTKPVEQRFVDEAINFSSTIRNNWVAAKARQISPDAHVLDAGAGQGQYKPLFSHTRYVSQDFAQYKGSDAPDGHEDWKYNTIDLVCDITKIPKPDSTFDVILCTEVLEHIPNPVLALGEFARLLRPGGSLILSAPLGSGMHQEPYHFYGGFSRHFYQHFLPQLGFDIVEIVPIGGLLKHVGQESHRASRVIGRSLPGGQPPIPEILMQEWLPTYLSDMEKTINVEQFTVGYMVLALKRLS